MILTGPFQLRIVVTCPPICSPCCTRALCCHQHWCRCYTQGRVTATLGCCSDTHLLNEDDPEEPERCLQVQGPPRPQATLQNRGHWGCSLLAWGAEAGGLPLVLTTQPQEAQHRETPSQGSTPTSAESTGAFITTRRIPNTSSSASLSALSSGLMGLWAQLLLAHPMAPLPHCLTPWGRWQSLGTALWWEVPWGAVPVPPAQDRAGGCGMLRGSVVPACVCLERGAACCFAQSCRQLSEGNK